MIEIGEPVPASGRRHRHRSGDRLRQPNAATRWSFVRRTRSAATGGGIVYDEQQLRTTLRTGLDASLIHQALVETSLLGWKELEYEVLRGQGRQLHHRLQHGEHRSRRRAHRRFDRRRALADALRYRLSDAAHLEHQRDSRAQRAGRLQHFSSRCIRTAPNIRSSKSIRVCRVHRRSHQKRPAIRSQKFQRRSRSGKRSIKS